MTKAVSATIKPKQLVHLEWASVEDGSYVLTLGVGSQVITYAALSTGQFHVTPWHYCLEQPKIQTAVLGHSLVRSLVRSHRSLVRLLRTARALRCAHSFARSLTSLTPSLVGK